MIVLTALPYNAGHGAAFDPAMPTVFADAGKGVRAVVERQRHGYDEFSYYSSSAEVTALSVTFFRRTFNLI
jgi:hypothetical protein